MEYVPLGSQTLNKSRDLKWSLLPSGLHLNGLDSDLKVKLKNNQIYSLLYSTLPVPADRDVIPADRAGVPAVRAVYMSMSKEIEIIK